MQSDTKRPIWLGALVAPSAGPILYFLGLLVLAPPPLSGPADVLAGLYMVCLIGLPVAYVASLLLGVPTVLLLREFGVLHLEWTLIIGAVVGSLTLLWFHAWAFGVDFLVAEGPEEVARCAAIGASLGVGVGAVFCKICGITRRPDRRSQTRMS